MNLSTTDIIREEEGIAKEEEKKKIEEEEKVVEKEEEKKKNVDEEDEGEEHGGTEINGAIRTIVATERMVPTRMWTMWLVRCLIYYEVCGSGNIGYCCYCCYNALGSQGR